MATKKASKAIATPSEEGHTSDTKKGQAASRLKHDTNPESNHNQPSESPGQSFSDHEVPVQPGVNIGLFGHVDHGKTTLVKTFTGKWTDTHSEEIKRGITIRLGYADATFYQCNSCTGVERFGVHPTCAVCKGEAKPIRRLSFIDAPGHESLMATMLAGATIIDGALLLVSAGETCPQPQTREHLMALEILGVNRVVVVQNKVDLVSEEAATKNYNQIKEFLNGTMFEHAPIIPLSGQHGVNIDALIQAINETIPTPKRDGTKEPLLSVARSFDVNKPGSSPLNIMGGIIGGTLKQGTLSLGQEIEILPGYLVEEKNRKVAKPLHTTIVSLMTGGTSVESIHPGGSVAVATTLDPSIVKSDKLTGAVVGLTGKLPPVWYTLTLEPHLLKRVVGTKEDLNVDPIKMGEVLMLNVNSAATAGIVNELSKKEISCPLKIPVCAEEGSRVTISRRIGNRFRLIGYGILKA